MRSYLFLPTGPEINRALLLTKTDELDRKIKALTSMRDGLRHTAHCTAPNHVEYPKFLRILRVEGKNRNRQPTKLKEKKFKPGVHFTMGGQVRLPPHRRPSLRSSRHRALRGKPLSCDAPAQNHVGTLASGVPLNSAPLGVKNRAHWEFDVSITLNNSLIAKPLTAIIRS